MRRLAPIAVAAAALLALSMPARADVPWAQGVSKDKQQQANALFAEGNELFAQQAHAPALEKYRAAIALWDHPLIEFNLAVTLIRLDRILEAADTIDKALRFGATPFPSPEQYQQALDYQKLVGGQVGTIEASCEQAGASISLDGKAWFGCPGKQSVRVLAGEHLVVVEAKGFMTVSRRTVVIGGGSSSGTYHLLPIDSVVELEYPTRRWIPWSVAGGGLAVGLGGLAVWLGARSDMDRFHDRYETLCPDGCPTSLDEDPTQRDLADQRDSAHARGNIGIGLMIAGGAVTAGGIVWTVLNRPRRVMPKLEVTPTSFGAGAAITF